MTADSHHLTSFLANDDWLERTGTEYFLQVDGDCMAPGIRNADFVGVKATLPASKASDSDIVVARVKLGGHVLKRFRRINGDAWLVPDNPAYAATETIPAEDATIIGVVVGVIHWRD